MRAKLGLSNAQPEDPRLIVDLLDALAAARADYPTFFAAVAELGPEPSPLDQRLSAMFGEPQTLRAWLARYRIRAARQSDEPRRAATASAANPRYVLRNHLAQTAIEAAEAGDFGEVERLWKLLRDPYREHPGAAAYARPAPAGAVPVCVSCSS
jgi:uncharacterized protein YdiU (UPF0061 family)